MTHYGIAISYTLFHFPLRLQLNSDFSHTVMNGQLTRCTTIKIKTKENIQKQIKTISDKLLIHYNYSYLRMQL